MFAQDELGYHRVRAAKENPNVSDGNKPTKDAYQGNPNVSDGNKPTKDAYQGQRRKQDVYLNPTLHSSKKQARLLLTVDLFTNVANNTRLQKSNSLKLDEESPTRSMFEQEELGYERVRAAKENTNLPDGNEPIKDASSTTKPLVLLAYGEIIDVKVDIDIRYSGTRSYGYLKMQTLQDANCVSKLNNANGLFLLMPSTLLKYSICISSIPNLNRFQNIIPQVLVPPQEQLGQTAYCAPTP
ncbi:hypothetical protein QE152_g10598 [Popillia japonica]|uniref:Uncharacterized protein n=1 Tax=Popillia japonica TaxID=7064 RepID=A0AAW1LQN4_POPJA